MKNIFIALLLLTFTACQSNKTHKVSDAEIQKTTTATDSVATTLEVQSEIEQDDASQDEQNVSNDIPAKSLNDIRFDGWTEEDWLNNDYIRALRTHIDAYCRGEIKNPELDKYKPIMQSKFVVLKIEPLLTGGAFITIVFLDNPQCVFESGVHSKVDSNNNIFDYAAYRLSLVSTDFPIAKEEILDLVKEHPEHKLW